MKQLLLITNKTLGKVESFFLLFFIFNMIFFSSAQIILRYFFNESVTWFAPMLRGIVLWTALIGGAKSIELQKAIKIDIIHHFLNIKTKDIIDKILNIAGFILCGFIFFIAYKFVIIEKEFGEIYILNIKMWQLEIALPVGFFLMSFHFFANIFQDKTE